MSPFFSGALGALAVVITLRVARGAAWYHRARRFRAGGPPRAARRLAARIGASPAQEEVLASEATSLAKALHGVRREVAEVREAIAALLTAESLDAAALAAALDRPAARIAEVRARLEAAVARIHGALGPAERERLADVLRNLGRWHRPRLAHG
jgi:uncharacterized membrane protein